MSEQLREHGVHSGSNGGGPGGGGPGGGPEVAAVAVLLDPVGRVLLVGGSEGRPALPTTAVLPGESPARALVRGLAAAFGVRTRAAGPLLATDTVPDAGRIVFLYDVDPLTDAQLAEVRALPDADFADPAEAGRRLPGPEGARLAAALHARRTGRSATLEGGSPHAREPGPNGLLSHTAYIAERPKVLASAAVVFRDSAGRVLLVKPNYLGDGLWLLPGGSIESDEDELPRQAAHRETLEEIGLDVPPGPLISLDWVLVPNRPPMVSHTYDGGVLTDAQLGAIRLQEEELDEWRLFPRDELTGRLPGGMGARIELSLRARDDGRQGALELVNGQPVDEG